MSDFESDSLYEDEIVNGQVENAKHQILALPEVQTALGFPNVTQRLAHDTRTGPASINPSTLQMTLNPRHDVWWPDQDDQYDDDLRAAWSFVVAAHEIRHLYPFNIELYRLNTKLAELDCDWFAGEMFAVFEFAMKASHQIVSARFNKLFRDSTTHPDGLIRSWAFTQGYLWKRANP